MKLNCFLLISMLSFLKVSGQEPNISAIIDEINNQNEMISTEKNIEYLYEHFYLLYLNPINLNDANHSDLKRLLIISDFQIHSIIEYRKRYGNFLSLNEIILIYGFDNSLVSLIKPFLTIEKNRKSSKNKRYSHHLDGFVMSRIDRKYPSAEGYNDTIDAFLGAPFKMIHRIKAKYKNYEAGITAEKDPGETTGGPYNQYGFDHYSGYIAYNGEGIINKVIAGNYTVNQAQGINMWGGFNCYNSHSLLDRRKNGHSCKGYSSSSEDGYFRGVIMQGTYKHFDFHLFTSYRKRDASFDQDSLYGSYIRTFINDGTHNTLKKNQKENSLKETALGSSLKYTGKKINLSYNLLQLKWVKPLLRKDYAYNKYLTHYRKKVFHSIGYLYRWKQAYFYGEIAFADKEYTGLITGINFQIENIYHLYFKISNYGSFVYNPYSSFDGSGKPYKKTSLYAAIKVIPDNWLQLAAYSKHECYHEPTYTIHIPHKKSYYMLKAVISPGDEYQVSGLFRTSRLAKTVDNNDQKTECYKNYWKHKIRLNLRYSINNSLTLINRLEWSTIKESPVSKGFLFFSQFNYRMKDRLRLYGRYCLYETDDYSSRIYAYENDVLYAFSLPAFYGKGHRISANASVSITPDLTFYLKWGHTKRYDKDGFGSSINRINKSSFDEIRVQIKFDF